MFVATQILDWSGLVQGAEQPESALLAVRAITAIVPFLCLGAAAAAATRYGLSRQRHAEILSALEQQRTGQSASAG